MQESDRSNEDDTLEIDSALIPVLHEIFQDLKTLDNEQRKTQIIAQASQYIATKALQELQLLRDRLARVEERLPYE